MRRITSKHTHNRAVIHKSTMAIVNITLESTDSDAEYEDIRSMADHVVAHALLQLKLDMVEEINRPERTDQNELS